MFYTLWIGNGYLDKSRNTEQGLQDVQVCKKLLGSHCYIKYNGGQMEQVLEDAIEISYFKTIEEAENAVLQLRQNGIKGDINLLSEDDNCYQKEIKTYHGGNIMTNTIKMETLNEELTALNTLITSEKPNFDAIMKQRKAVDEAVKAVNTEITETRINELLSMEKVAMFTDFIDNRFVMHIKLIEEENHTFATENVQKQISFVQLEKASKKAICEGVYEKLIPLFMDNLYRNIKEDLAVKGISANTPKLNGEYAELRKKHKFTETSMVAMEKQLNTILSYLLPEDLGIKAVKADVKYLQYVLTRVKGGTLTIMQEKTFINELFAMLYFRKNKIAYQFQTRMNAHKSIV